MAIGHDSGTSLASGHDQSKEGVNTAQLYTRCDPTAKAGRLTAHRTSVANRFLFVYMARIYIVGKHGDRRFVNTKHSACMHGAPCDYPSLVLSHTPSLSAQWRSQLTKKADKKVGKKLPTFLAVFMRESCVYG